MPAWFKPLGRKVPLKPGAMSLRNPQQLTGTIIHEVSIEGKHR